jgi:hypothetical protein
MAHDLFRAEFVTRVRSALARADEIALIEHHGLAGRAREVFVKDLLRPILPPYVELGSGKLADSEGRLSRETDVVIYSAATLPPLLLEAGFGIYPAEACIYAIEVKSTLTAHELRNAIVKHQELRALRYLPSAVNEIFQAIGAASRPVIPALFAFRTDLAESGKGELARYRELDGDADSNPAIPVFCVAGRGYWWFKPNEPAQKWINHPPSPEHEEVIDFLGGVANTVPDQIVLKGRPRFGNYIIRPREFRKE